MSFDNPTEAQPDMAALQKQLADAQAAMAQAGVAVSPEAEAIVEADVANPATTVAPEPVAVQAEVVVTPEQQEQVTSALATAQGASFLSNIDSGGDTMNALMGAVESDGGGNSNHLYPILTQQSGVTGGALQRAGHMSATEAANLPEGMSPFTAVFMGYRFICTAWPEGAGGAKKQPLFSCALNSSQGELVNKLMTIGKNYQFTKGADKVKYDIANKGCGHIRPQLELLLFDAEYGDIFTFQTCSHYNSAKDTRDQLIKNATTIADGSKSMLPFVGTFSPKSHSAPTKSGNDVVHHYVEITTMSIADAATKTAWDAWQKFSEDARADASIMAKVNDWFAGNDSIITQQCRDALDLGLTLA